MFFSDINTQDLVFSNIFKNLTSDTQYKILPISISNNDYNTIKTYVNLYNQYNDLTYINSISNIIIDYIVLV